MADQFQGNVDTLFKGMENFVTSKTCVGDPIRIGDTIILPLVDVSFGLLASSKNERDRRNGGGGMGGKMSPSAVIVIQNGNCKLINIKNQDAATKIIDMVPDLVDRLTGKTKSVAVDEEVDKAITDVKEKK